MRSLSAVLHDCPWTCFASYLLFFLLSAALRAVCSDWEGKKKAGLRWIDAEDTQKDPDGYRRSATVTLCRHEKCKLIREPLQWKPLDFPLVSLWKSLPQLWWNEMMVHLLCLNFTQTWNHPTSLLVEKCLVDFIVQWTESDSGNIPQNRSLNVSVLKKKKTVQT